MKNLIAEFDAAKKLLEKARNIVILSHRHPDGDTIGANLGLRLALAQEWGRQVISACVDAPPESAHFLPEVGSFVKDFDLSWADVVVTVDVGASYMTKFHETKPGIFLHDGGNPPVINIDHHASNDMFGSINMVDPDAAAATLVVYNFLKYCGFKITRSIATCLLHGLYFDTGSFHHSNTTPEVLQMASDLVWKGADFRTIAKKQFKTMTIPQLKIYGKILERARVNEKKLTFSAVTEQDFRDTAARPDDTVGAIDYLNSIPDGNFCCLIAQDKNGTVKGSLRSRVDDIDLSRLAGLFGGGGHKKAAGFSFPGRLIEVGDEIKIEGDFTRHAQ